MKKKKTKKAGGASKKDKAEAAAAEPSASKEKEPEPDEPTTPAEAADEEEKAEEQEASEAVAEQPTYPTASQPSLAQQSKLRSASFKQGSAPTGPLSPGPEGETATDIYRKHVARIEELEKENKRLAKESTDSERRWKKAEEELADLRETEGETKGADSQLEKLVSRTEPHLQVFNVRITLLIFFGHRNPRSRLSSVKTPSCSNKPPAAATARRHPSPCPRLPLSSKLS